MLKHAMGNEAISQTFKWLKTEKKKAQRTTIIRDSQSLLRKIERRTIINE